MLLENNLGDLTLTDNNGLNAYQLALKLQAKDHANLFEQFVEKEDIEVTQSETDKDVQFIKVNLEKDYQEYLAKV